MCVRLCGSVYGLRSYYGVVKTRIVADPPGAYSGKCAPLIKKVKIRKRSENKNRMKKKVKNKKKTFEGMWNVLPPPPS